MHVNINSVWLFGFGLWCKPWPLQGLLGVLFLLQGGGRQVFWPGSSIVSPKVVVSAMHVCWSKALIPVCRLNHTLPL